MHTKNILTVLLLVFSYSAVADFTTTTRAYEISLSNVQVPVTSTGSLVFKECADCDRRVILMTSNTQFIVNGKSVGIKEFRKNVFNVRDRDNELVSIKHHLRTDTITSLRVTL